MMRAGSKERDWASPAPWEMGDATAGRFVCNAPRLRNHAPSPMTALRCLPLAALCLASLCPAEDWPQWRGPHRNGISDEKDWSAPWPAGGPKVLWKANVGIGFASFTVAGNRVFTTGNTENTDAVFCFDAGTGKELWKHRYPADLGDKYYEGGTAATPVVDGDRLYHLSRWGDVFCFEAATGKIIWSKNIQQETNIRIPDWGFSGSPLVHARMLVLNIGSAGLALDKASGNILWKSEDDNAGYSTPLPFTHGDDLLAIIGSGKSWVAVDIKTGTKAWEFPWPTRYGVNAADPVVHGDSVFISSGYNKGCALLKIDSNSPVAVWQNKELKNQLASSVLLDGFLYGFDGDNTASRSPLKCLDFATGALKWEEIKLGPGALMAADGKLIILSGKGELIVAKASPKKFEVLCRGQVLTGKCWTQPVLANGRIYCRNAAGGVVCLDVHSK